MLESLLTYLLSSIKTLVLYVLILVIFGFAFLFTKDPLCNGDNICALLELKSLAFTKIDLGDWTNIVRSLVFSYIVGLLLYIFGVWCFRLFRWLDLWQVRRWRIEKKLGGGNETALEKIINDAEISEYLEKHPHVADIYTLEQIHSTITRPLFSFFSICDSPISGKMERNSIVPGGCYSSIGYCWSICRQGGECVWHAD